jgi:hypothetical protein
MKRSSNPTLKNFDSPQHSKEQIAFGKQAVQRFINSTMNETEAQKTISSEYWKPLLT